jgi:hypothetical protein
MTQVLYPMGRVVIQIVGLVSIELNAYIACAG